MVIKDNRKRLEKHTEVEEEELTEAANAFKDIGVKFIDCGHEEVRGSAVFDLESSQTEETNMDEERGDCSYSEEELLALIADAEF